MRFEALWCVTVAGLFAFAPATWGSEPVRPSPDRTLAPEEGATILVLHSNAPSGALAEGLVYTSGELAAVGFRVQTRSVAKPLEPDQSWPLTAGTLAFERSGSRIIIRAWPPDRGNGVTQAVDLDESNVTAEVIGVRALETLRVVLLQYARRAECSEQPYPDVVRRFVRVDDTALEPSNPPVATSAEPAGSSASDETSLELALAGQLMAEPSGETALGGAGQIFVVQSWYHIGVRGSALFSPFGLNSESSNGGRAEVGRYAGEVQVKLQVPMTANVDWFGQLGGGVVVYPIRGLTTEGFAGRHEDHVSPLFSVETGAALHVSDAAAVFLSAGLSAATTPPRILLEGREEPTLEDPTLTLSIGLATR